MVQEVITVDVNVISKMFRKDHTLFNNSFILCDTRVLYGILYF
jgi:hypothetical protein